MVRDSIRILIMIVKEYDTEVLVNILKKDYKDIVRQFDVIFIKNNTIDIEDENMMVKWSSVSEKSSMRAVLKRGKYKLRFRQYIQP